MQLRPEMGTRIKLLALVTTDRKRGTPKPQRLLPTAVVTTSVPGSHSRPAPPRHLQQPPQIHLPAQARKVHAGPRSQGTAAEGTTAERREPCPHLGRAELAATTPRCRIAARSRCSRRGERGTSARGESPTAAVPARALPGGDLRRWRGEGGGRRRSLGTGAVAPESLFNHL
jgi:hypothetical protein